MRRSKLRFGILLGLLIALAPLANVPVTTAQAQVTITLGAVNVGVAETARLEARIDCPAANCGAFTFNFHFDRDKIRLSNAASGPFLGSAVLGTTQTLDNAQGIAQLAFSPTGTPPAGADNLLFTLDVGGLIPGDAAITVDSVQVMDTAGAPLAASAAGTTVTVVETGKIAFFSPPANTWIVAFTSERDGNPEIYVANGDGSSPRRLTDNPALDGAPAWSPDGRIAFHSARDGNLELYVMNADGSGVTRLTDNPASDSDPAWSPDGNKIAFVSDRDGNPEIYVMSVVSGAAGSSPMRVTNDPGVDTFPAWSPDGAEIAFTSNRSRAAEVYLMAPDGGNAHQVTGLFGANGWYPAWSPDSSRLSLTVERDNLADIYTMTRQAQNSTPLTKKPGEMSLTDWSPDGGWLAYMNAPDGNKDLLVIDTQGQYLFRLTDNPADDYDPDWHAGTPAAPAATTSSEPCTVSTPRRDVSLRVGPGNNRGIFTSLVPSEHFTVVGRARDGEGRDWWEIDKTQVQGSDQVISLWVAQDDVQASGGCALVREVPPPPVIPGGQPQNPGSWGDCGSCQTCGHAANECETSPTGECVWDPARCAAPPPPSQGGEPGCLTVSVSAQPAGAGTAYIQNPSNCFKPGDTVMLYTFSTSASYFTSWTGTCPNLGKDAAVTFTITASCSAVAHY